MNPTFKAKSELELMESYAEAMGGISTEEELSEVFDQHVETYKFDLNDKPALRQAFNDWKDSMCREGYIHPVQAHEYCYEGELFDN